MKWIVNRQDNDSPLVVIAENGQWVCKVSTENNWAQQSEETQKANAALIASAPELLAENTRLKSDKAELLEALEMALATIERIKPNCCFDSTGGTKNVIRNAIARAKGEA